MSSDHYFIPVSIVVAPLTWIPLEYRVTDWKLAYESAPPECARMTDPATMTSDCPSTVNIAAMTTKFT